MVVTSVEEEEKQAWAEDGYEDNLSATYGAVAAAPTLGGMDMQNSPPDVVQVPEFSPPAEVPTGPPVPAAGLPDGWTMEQWGHYGQQWLDNQQ